MKLHEVAHSRTGDKGNTSNISVIVFWFVDFAMIRERVTEARVAHHLSSL